MSNLMHHAADELDRIGMTADNPDYYSRTMREHILMMVRIFSEEGHSGFSAAYAISSLVKLLKFEPLSPLTGADDEWTEVQPGLFQNRRCPRVFKDAKGNAYDVDGHVFEDPDGSRYTNRESQTPVTFPYTPETEIVKR